jgi:hypothetical protein
MSYDPCSDPHILANVARAKKPISPERLLTVKLILAPVIDALASGEKQDARQPRCSTRRAA